MKILSAIKLSYQASIEALKHSPYAIVFVIAAEGAQHIAEWHLGMFESKAAFQMSASETLRLVFGIIKVVSVLVAFYFVSKKLFEQKGPVSRYGSFNKDLLRPLWDPRSGSTLALVTMIAYAAPLMFVHYQLHLLAMGTTIAPVLLFFDSVVVGLMALTLASSYWAGTTVDSDAHEPLGMSAR